MELINETVQRWRDWGYCYYVIDRDQLIRDSSYTVLPKDSYVYNARIAGRIVCVVQVPIGAPTTEFLLHHSASVIKPLPSVLQR